MPQAGFEPAHKRFLRPPPLPLGYCGQLQCSEQDSNLHHRDSRSRASIGWATGACLHAHFQWTLEGVEPSLSGCRPDVLPLDDGPEFSFSLSVARRIRTFILELRRLVLIRLSYRNTSFLPTAYRLPPISNDPGRIRTCTKLVLSQPPLPSWATGPAFLSYLRS